MLESGIQLIFYAASILSAGSRPDSSSFGSGLEPRLLDGTVDSPSATVVVELVHPHLREVSRLLLYLVLLAHERACEPVEGNTCTTRDLHFISRLVPSCTFLVRRHFHWVGGKPR